MPCGSRILLGYVQITSKMIIYFYLFILLLFVSTDSSSIRSRNNKNDLVPFMSSRSVSEKRAVGKEATSNEPFILQPHLPNSGNFGDRRKDKIKKRPSKKRISKLKSLRKKQRMRRELQIPKLKSFRGEYSNSQEISQAVNATESLQNITNSIRKVDILKALSDYSKKLESKLSKIADPNFKDYKKKDAETRKHAASTRNQNNHHLSEPLLKMVYPNTPKTDRHQHKYTYRDLMTDRERLEQKIKYIKHMLNVNQSAVDDSVRVRRRSDSDRTANRIAKMFLTLSAVNGLNDRRKSKCEEDDDEENHVQDVWEGERKERSSRKSSSSNEQRYKVKKWIEFMKNKRSSGKTCPCMALTGEERDVFPLEQTLPKGYLLMDRRDSNEESAETYKDPFYSSRDKPNRDSFTRRRLNKNQEDQDSKLKGLPKNGKKKTDVNFTDLELYRSRAKQILRNAEEILDRIKEEEEKRISAPNLFMSRLRELTSAIQGDPRNNENDLIRKLQKNLDCGPLAQSCEGAGGNQFMDNVKSFILDPYEKAKALTDESTRKLSSYLLQNLGKIQEPSEEQIETVGAEDESGQANIKAYFGEMPSKEEKPLSDSLTKEDVLDPDDMENNKTYQEEPYKQRKDDKIKQQQIKSDEHKIMQDLDGSRKETERVADKATETVRENQEPILEDKVSMQLKQPDSDRISESRGKATKGTEEMEVEKAPEEKSFLQPEGTIQEEKGDLKGTASGDMQTEEKLQEEILQEIVKTINKDMSPLTDEWERKVENLQRDEEDPYTQDRKEITQSKHSSEDANQEEVQEVVASSQKTSGEVSDRDENDVVSSPHLADDYDLLNEREDQEFGRPTLLTDTYYDPSLSEEGTPTANNPYVKASEDSIQIKSKDEMENQENLETEKSEVESTSNISKELSNLDSKEAVGLEERVREKKPMEGTEVSSDEKQGEGVTDIVHSTKELPESADLVKASKTSKESSEIEQISDSIQSYNSNEDMEEKEEATLKMVQPDTENNRSPGEETDGGNTDEETLLKVGSKIQDSEDVEAQDTQEDSDNTTLKLTPDGSSKDFGTEKAAQDDQDLRSIEREDETPLRAENLQTPKEDSSDETFLKEVLEKGTLDETEDYDANLRAPKPIEEIENQEVTKNRYEDSEEALLKEAKETQNSEEVQVTAATNDQNETDLRETSSEVNSNEEGANDEGNYTPLKEFRDEGLEEDVKTLNAESTGQEGKDDTQNLSEFSDKEMLRDEGGEETLKSENIGETESNHLNEEKKENEQEIIEKVIPEESNENLKLEKSVNEEHDSIETTEGLKEEQENSEDESLLQASDPGENLDVQTEIEGIDNEDTLRTQNPHQKTDDQNEETSREIQTPINQEDLETDDETALQQANPEKKSMEEQNSSETTKSTSENESQENLEVESGETIKTANPNDVNQNLEEQKADGGSERVKAIFEDDEEPNEDQENVKAVMESETQDNSEDIEALRAESSLEEIEERKSSEDEYGENVKAILADENPAKLGENDEAVKEVNVQQYPENDVALADALENPKTVDDDDETVQKKAKSKEELEQNEELMENEEKSALEDELKERIAIQAEDVETPLRQALSLENLEEKDETFKAEAETPNGEENQESDSEVSMRRVMEDELDNKIEDESTFRAKNPIHGMDDDLDPNRSKSEESLRENSNEEDEGKDERVKSENFGTHQPGRNLNVHGYETLMKDLLDEYAAEDIDSTLRDATPVQKAELEENGSQLSDLFQIPESTSKSLKGHTLKVPKSIGKIMSDLEGKTKDGISSIQNLDPDKIDHIIGKIGEAEQNLLETQEVDCRKECACAEEMNTRSRNIGRYEIAKDILHWMKDLQLNRVLSDD